jgi:hypothetical protein
MNVAGKMKSHLKTVCNTIAHSPRNVREFGGKYAVLQLQKSLSIIKLEDYIDRMTDVTDKELVDVIKKYQNVGGYSFRSAKKEIGGQTPIFILWFQGENRMPELCQLCLYQLRKIAPENCQIIFLTNDNYLEYIDLPDEILAKFHQGLICPANFSDIVRHALLRDYGGWWIDAAVFTVNGLFGQGQDMQYFSPRFDDEHYLLQDVSKGRWINGSVFAKKDNIVSSFIYDALVDLWIKHDIAIDFLAVDYIMWVGYRDIPQFKAAIDAVELNNKNFRCLNRCLEEVYSVEKFTEVNEILNSNKIQLINRHREYKKTVDGKTTIYGFLVSEMGKLDGRKNQCNNTGV